MYVKNHVFWPRGKKGSPGKGRPFFSYAHGLLNFTTFCVDRWKKLKKVALFRGRPFFRVWRAAREFSEERAGTGSQALIVERRLL